MIDRATKLRWRRRMRRSRLQVEDIGYQAEEHIERHFFRRLIRLANVRRFVLSWILLLGLLTGGVVAQSRMLSPYYQELRPVEGGVYVEGVVGAFTNANPLYSSGPVDRAVSRLLFSGLMKYDQDNQLVGDLAEKWEVDERGLVYTVTLKPNLQWHDGQAITAQDVVFTYATLQNPDAKSPYAASWQDVKTEAKDERTVVFTLPNVLASFPFALTNGIVPEHLLMSTPVTQLRTLSFNTSKPVGSGPFKWESIEVTGNTPQTREEQIGLIPNENYHGGEPKLGRFTVRAFRSEDAMLRAFRESELAGMSGLGSAPDDLPVDLEPQEHNIPFTGEVMVFLKTDQEVLSDVKVRQALVRATDQMEVINGLGYPVVMARSPLLSSHLGYTDEAVQLEHSVDEAKSILEQAGWIQGKDGIRFKDGKPLTFTLSSQSTNEYAHVSQKLQEQWRRVGFDVKVNLQPELDLQGSINVHAYDALLYGISLGVDPDVFPYWHSSQGVGSANRLNFSDYKSAAADKALEAGRTRSDNALRAVKYRPFLDAWRNDAPAIALYQPRYLYVTRGTVHGFSPKTMNVAIDRYSNVNKWMIRRELQDK